MTRSLTVLRSAELATVEQQTSRAYETLEAAKSTATRRAYRIGWADFLEYTSGLRSDQEEIATTLPAAPATVALYMNHLALDRALAPSTIAQRMAAIRYYHDQAGAPSPTTDPVVIETMKGIRRLLAGRKVQRKGALTIADLEQILSDLPDTPGGRRDAALLTIGLFGAFRRSELAALDLEDVMFDQVRGAVVTLRRSKTDQMGEGMDKVLPYKHGRRCCPVIALRSWLEIRGSAAGPLFSSVGKSGKVTGKRLDGRDVARILVRVAEMAGIDSAELAGHSLRIGFVTECRRRGVDSAAIMAQTGHKTERMITLYTRRESAWEANGANHL
jgi:integrase